MWSSPKRLLAVMTLSLASAGLAQAAEVAVDFQNNLIAFGCQTNLEGCNVGYTFQVTQNVTVVSLGTFSGNVASLNASHPTAIWDANNAMVAFATVDPSLATAVASDSGLGSFLFSAITPMDLTPGAYTIATFYRPTFDEAIYTASAGITEPGIVIGLPMQGFAASLMQPMTQISTQRLGYFGPSLQIATVPEPSIAALLAISAVCALLAGRRRRPTRLR